MQRLLDNLVDNLDSIIIWVSLGIILGFGFYLYPQSIGKSRNAAPGQQEH